MPRKVLDPVTKAPLRQAAKSSSCTAEAVMGVTARVVSGVRMW